MKTLTHLSLLLWSLCASFQLIAQTQTFENGNLRWKMSPNGDLHNYDSWLEMNVGNQWTPIVFSPELLIAGKSPNDELALQKTGMGGEPRMAGSDYTLNKIWTITANDVEQHLADLADNGQIDNPIPAIFQWPGRSSIFFNPYNGMSLPEEDLSRLSAGFFDSQGTGAYNPSSGDYPIVPIRNCSEPIVPSQMHYCVFTRPEGPYPGPPLPLEIHLYIFAFGCDDEHLLNQTVFVYHQLIYTTEEDNPTGHPPFNDCYLSQLARPRIYCGNTDYMGTFPDLKAVFVYHSEQDDCDENIFGGQPPAIGLQMLRGPLNATGQPVELSSSMYVNTSSLIHPPPAITMPTTPIQYYNYMQGKWRDGTDLTYGGTGYGGTEPTSFVFPGLPVQPGGWTEWEEQNSPGTRNTFLNFGPFEFQPGAVNEVLTAYSYYRGPGSHLDQAEGLYDQMVLVQSLVDACFVSGDTPGFPECEPLPVSVIEAATGTQTLRVFPNPFTDWLVVELPEQNSSYLLTLYDLQGRTLWKERRGAGQQRLNLPELPEGIYLLKAESSFSAPMLAKVVR